VKSSRPTLSSGSLTAIRWMDIEKSVSPAVAAKIARATNFGLVPLVFRALERGHVVDLQIERRKDGVYVLCIHELQGDLVVNHEQLEVGQLGDIDDNDVRLALLWCWASTLHDRVRRSLTRVTAATSSGRT
jgi:hypothetical protein